MELFVKKLEEHAATMVSPNLMRNLQAYVVTHSLRQLRRKAKR